MSEEQYARNWLLLLHGEVSYPFDFLHDENVQEP